MADDNTTAPLHRDVMDVYAAAAWLGLAKGTLQNWRYAGKGPRFVKLGGTVRYRASDLEDWLDENTREPAAGPGAA